MGNRKGYSEAPEISGGVESRGRFIRGRKKGSGKSVGCFGRGVSLVVSVFSSFLRIQELVVKYSCGFLAAVCSVLFFLLRVEATPACSFGVLVMGVGG